MGADIWETFSKTHLEWPALIELNGHGQLQRQWGWSYVRSLRNILATRLLAYDDHVHGKCAFIVGGNSLEVGKNYDTPGRGYRDPLKIRIIRRSSFLHSSHYSWFCR